MRQEYIFSYPVVRGDMQGVTSTSSSSALATASTAQKFIEKLKTVHTTATCLDTKTSPDHDNDSICSNCHPTLAHMFLGYLPKLYYSLKFTQWRFEKRWDERLQGRKDKEEIKDNTQKLATINQAVTEIKNFCLSLGYDGTKLGATLFPENVAAQNGTELSTQFNECFGLDTPSPPPDSKTNQLLSSIESIHSLFEKLIKTFINEKHDEAMQEISKGRKDLRKIPSSIRDMLHWLSGVPYCVRFKTNGTDPESMEGFYGKLCELTDRGNGKADAKDNLIKKENLEHRLALSCAQSLDVITVIEDPLGKEPLKRLTLYAECAKFYYPNDAGTLYYMFVEMLYKVFIQMRFVMQMTGREAALGGWKECVYTEDGPIGQEGILCRCPKRSFFEVTCPAPLRRYLQDHHKDVLHGPKLGFKLKEDKSTLATCSIIHPTLLHTFGTNMIYTVLCRDLVALSQWPPFFVGDMIAFMVGIYGYWEGENVDDYDGITKDDMQRVKEDLHTWIEWCPGTFEARKLTNALADVVKGHKDSSGGAGAGGTSHTNNLTSLMNCEDALKPTTPPTCAPYLKPMAYDVYTVFVPQFSRSYLSWILHFGPGIYGALKELKEELGAHTCAISKDTSPPPKDSIVQCPFVLPKLYNLGCDFWDPKILSGNNTKKTCESFRQQLEKVLTTCETSATASPLHKLIETIEQFLWSIRLPFAGSQLALWCLTLCFLCYVFVVPLDHFHIRSHYFNKLRFTIHPSLLLAHQQRRVSEVSYFFDHPIKEIVLNSSGRELPYFIPMV